LITSASIFHFMTNYITSRYSGLSSKTYIILNMASHLFGCHDRKERGTFVNTEEQRKGVLHVIESLKTKQKVNVHFVYKYSGRISRKTLCFHYKSRPMNTVWRSKDFLL